MGGSCHRRFFAVADGEEGGDVVWGELSFADGNKGADNVADHFVEEGAAADRDGKVA